MTDRGTLTEAQKGWIAGIIDGEGCLCIYRRRDRMRKREHRVDVVVGNTDRRMVARLQELVGGELKVHTKPKIKNHKQQWHWRVSGYTKVGKLLTMLIPYFVVKKERAELVVEFCGTKTRARREMTPKLFVLRESMELGLKRMNKRGVG